MGEGVVLLQGKPLLQQQIELMREMGASEVFILGRAGVDYGAFDCPVLRDRFEDLGPLAAIYPPRALKLGPRAY
jgi:molybdopterin-guanine dinucleotide biosynthesis protein A